MKIIEPFINKKNWLITILTMSLIAPFVLFDLQYESLLTGGYTDFSLYDFYAREISNSAHIKSFSKDVVVVTIDGCPRKEIHSIIDSIDNKGTKVIGLDIIFKIKNNDDSLLIKSICNANAKIVLAARVDEVEDLGYFRIVDKPYFSESLCNIKDSISLGAVNLSSSHGIVRSFKPTFYLGNEACDDINQFGAEITRQYSDDAFNKLKARGDDILNINFHKNNTDLFSWEELKKEIPIDMKDKIVLIGYEKDVNDLKMTPIKEDMAGIIIQAKIIQSILEQSYITNSSTIFNKMIALIFSFIFVWTLILLSRLHDIGNLISRILQITLLLVIIIIGINSFEKNYYIDTFYTILCVGISQICFDVVTGITGIYSRLKNRFKI